MDNFKNEQISEQYRFIQLDLSTFYNRPFQGMSEQNTLELLQEISRLTAKLNK
jgi:hypothetical protein